MQYVLVDRFEQLVRAKFGLAVKTITHGEDFLAFDMAPVPYMPLSLLIEAQAQTAGIVVAATYGFRGKALLAKVDRAEMSRPLTTGDRLVISARMESIKGQTCAMLTTVEVDGVQVASMTSLYAVLELKGDAGRPFDTPRFYSKRADLLRGLGVYELLGLDPWADSPEKELARYTAQALPPDTDGAPQGASPSPTQP